MTPFFEAARNRDQKVNGRAARGASPAKVYAAALDVEANGSGVTYGTAGLRADFAATESLGLYARVGYQHAGGDVSESSSQRFRNGATSFDVDGVPLAENAGVADFGAHYG